MIEDIYDPLNEYISTFKDKFKKVADETFNALAEEAQIDVVDKSMQERRILRMCLVESRCGLSYASFCG